MTQLKLVETRICGAIFMKHPFWVDLNPLLAVCALIQAKSMPDWLINNYQSVRKIPFHLIQRSVKNSNKATDFGNFSE
jgi:hypothetical protein